MELEKQRPASTSCNTSLLSPTPVSGLRLKGGPSALIDSVTPHHAKCVQGCFNDNVDSVVWVFFENGQSDLQFTLLTLFTVFKPGCLSHFYIHFVSLFSRECFPCTQTVPAAAHAQQQELLTLSSIIIITFYCFITTVVDPRSQSPRLNT